MIQIGICTISWRKAKTRGRGRKGKLLGGGILLIIGRLITRGRGGGRGGEGTIISKGGSLLILKRLVYQGARGEGGDGTLEY